MDELNDNQFQRYQMNHIPVAEGLLSLNTLLHNKFFVNGNIIGHFARRSVQK